MNDVRIAQLSDLHFANETLEEVGRCTVFAVDWVTSQADIACAVISGDSTDHALDVHAPAVTALAREVRRLSQHCPVLMLQGTFSHEPPGTLNVFALLGGKYRVFVADRICQVALLAGGSWVSSSGWRFEEIPAGTRVVFSCLPSVNKGAVAAAAGAERADAAVGEQVAALLRGFSVANAQARSRGIPTVCISHGTVNGCYTEHGVPMAGLDHEFATGSLFDAGASAFMLGHIHKHQQWHDGGRKVAYPGSIGRLHFGEHGEKGFLDWRIGADAAELTLIATPAQRTIELDFDGPPDLERIRAIAREAQDVKVRVRWQVAESERDRVDRGAIEAALAGAKVIKLEGRVVAAQRARVEGISKAKSLAEKLARWAQASGHAVQPLADRLARLDAADADQLAADAIEQATRHRRVSERAAEAPGDLADREVSENTAAMSDLFGEALLLK